MIKLIKVLDYKSNSGVVTARFMANVNGKFRIVCDIYTDEQWSRLVNGKVLGV